MRHDSPDWKAANSAGDAPPRDDGASTGAPNDSLGGIAASCPVCFVCGTAATRTLIHPNARRSMLVALGVCDRHVDNAIAEVAGIQAIAHAMRGEATP